MVEARVSNNLPDVHIAAPAELEAAVALIISAATEEDRPAALAHTLKLVRSSHELTAGLRVVTWRGDVIGAMLAIPQPGRVAFVWPPGTADVRSPWPREQVEDALVQAVIRDSTYQGAIFAQALLSPLDMAQGEPLLRNGFERLTSLVFFRRDLDPAENFAADPALQFEPYHAELHAQMAQLLLESYVDTLDCPELNGTRTADEIFAGLRDPSDNPPRFWWLVQRMGKPVGLLLGQMQHGEERWELSYVGVAPQARRQGVGTAIIGFALDQARRAGARFVTLSVDARNAAALRRYAALGFGVYDERVLFLAILNLPAG